MASRCDRSSKEQSESRFRLWLRSGEHYGRKEAAWLARHAVRAICQEVIRTGGITVPLAVRFAERSEATPPEPNNVIQCESRPA